MKTIVLYNGKLLQVVDVHDVDNVKRCHSPLCTNYVQARPASGAGRPKWYCNKACRYKWKNRRREAKKYTDRNLKGAR